MIRPGVARNLRRIITIIKVIAGSLLILAALALPAVSCRSPEVAEKEKPPPPPVAVEFRGNSGISNSQLQEAVEPLLEDFRERDPEPADAEDLAYTVLRLYRSRGYPAATASGALAAERDRRAIAISIEEGARTFLGELAIEGEEGLAMPAKDIRACFEWEESGFMGLGAAVFSEPALGAGLANVRSLYELAGFLAVQVEARRQGPDEEGRVDVALSIREGKRYHLRRHPDISGAAAFSEEELRRALGIDLPIPASPRLPILLKGRLLDHYRNRGYRFVEIHESREVDDAAAEMRISFEIDEGPLTRVESIAIEGNESTARWAILSRVKLDPGDLYSEERVRDSYRSLLRSGLFSTVRIDSRLSPGHDDRVDLEVGVNEKPKWKFSLLAGYGSYEKLRGGASIENINVLGTGHSMRAEGIVHFKGERGTLTYLNPFFFHDRVSHSARGNYERREHPSFTRTEFGGQTGLAYLLTDNLRTSLSYHVRQSDVTEADAGIPDELVQDVFLSSVIWSSVLELRDNILVPDRGSNHRLNIEYSGETIGSDLNFFRYTASSTWVLPVWWRLRLVGAARAGVITRFSGTDVMPIQERFFSGGENTIRSFLEDEAGPKVKGDPIGGETFLTFNVEMRFPIFKDLHGAAFYDIGTVTAETNTFGGEKYFSGAGGGLRYHTPFGPLRFDAAANPRRRAGEDSWAFHFALGYPF